jgi:hypothetical protein
MDIDYKYKKGIELIKQVEKNKKSILLCNIQKNVKENNYDFVINEYISTHEKNSKNPTMKLSKIRPLGKWYEKFFGDNITTCFSHHAIFAMSKKDILKHPRGYYEKLIKELDDHFNPETGHYFERTWEAVFHPLDNDSKVKYSG